MAKQLNKPVPPKRRRPNRSRFYWTVFILSSLLSFGAGFWFTYRGTRVAVKEPPIAASTMPQEAVAMASAPPITTASPTTGPLVTPAPVDPFAAGPDSTPTPVPTPTPETTPASDAAPPRDQATPAPAADNPDQTDESSSRGKMYRVQVGNYDTESSAQSMVDELSAAGIHAVVVQDSSGQYHAQVGAYAKRDRALVVADEVGSKGYSVTVRQ